ncbi:hypothetical protein [Burkholderia ubonensis]|uniref:hypothetical protein n=1 Tax=Burkholderia ubonensis TaxID=101571 RepID=UPI0012F7D539|nr:hypothetical protein [Burkholderia ubonensis]
MQLVFLLFQLRLLAAVGDRRHCVDIGARLAGAAQTAENEMIPAAYFRIGNETDIERNRSESPRIIRIFRNNPESGSCRFGTRRHAGRGVPKLAVPGIAFNGNSIEFGAACRASCVRLDAPAICRRDYMNDQTIRASRFCVASADAARERCRCFPSPHTLMFF